VNPWVIQSGSDIDGNFENNYVYSVDGHSGGIKKLVFEPTVSRNCKLIDNHIIANSKTLAITPFDTWFVKMHVPGFFNDADIKCNSNFQYTRVGNTFHFQLDNKVGYVHLRWNSLSVMHKTFHNSDCIFTKDYVVHVNNN
jgi:hypothetical protein